MALCYLILFIALTNMPAKAEPWRSIFDKLLIDESDLTLRHQDIDDPFQLPFASELLTKPLQAPQTARLIVQDIRKASRPSEILIRQIKNLRPAGVPKKNNLPPASLNLKKIPGSELFQNAVKKIAAAAAQAHQEVDLAIKELSPEQRQKILDHLTPELESESLPLPDLSNPDQTWWDEEAERFKSIEKYPLASVLQAAAILMESIETNLPVLKREAGWAALKSPQKIQTALGDIMIGTPNADRYTTPTFLLIEPGGDDSYEGASGHGSMGNVSLLIDLAGHDRYWSNGAGQGSGIFGIGILVDHEGDDTYHAQSIAQGAGFFGAGILWDAAGRDSYRTGTFGQGAGAWGAGLLLDQEGFDTYQTGYLGQGVGLPGGFGVLADQEGNDLYLAGGLRPDPRGWMENYGRFRQGQVSQSLSQGLGLGWRDRAAGGIGILSDAKGNDVYQADYFAQGSGYWLGVGILADGSGHDRYLARRYSQGAGTHFAAGLLLDESGNDMYSSWAVSQGAGHDNSMGFLWDGMGDDIYAMDTGGFVQQGASNAGGLGILFDAQGQDQRAVGPTNTGLSNWDEKRQSQGIALALDVGNEHDWASRPVSTEPWTTVQGNFGLASWEQIGPDLGITPNAPEDAREPSGIARLRNEESSFSDERFAKAKTLQGRSQMSEYLAIASQWGGGGRSRQEAKFLLWKAARAENLPVFLTLLDPHDVFSILNLEEIFALTGAPAESALAGKLEQFSEKERSRALYLLGDLRSAAQAGAIAASLDDPAPRVRKQAARALARIVEKNYVKKLENLKSLIEKKSEAAEIRQWFKADEKITLLQLLFAIGLPEGEWSYFFEGLAPDPPPGSLSEMAALCVLQRRNEAASWIQKRIQELQEAQSLAPKLLSRLQDDDRDVRRWAVVGLGRSESRDLCPKTQMILEDSDYTVRFAAVKALAQVGSKACPEISRLQSSTNSNLRTKKLAEKIIP